MQPSIYQYSTGTSECDFLILAAGFEERAFRFLDYSHFSKNAYCILIKFDNNHIFNVEVYNKYKKRIEELFDPSRAFEVIIDQSKPQIYELNLTKIIPELPHDIGTAWVDISGMPTYSICSTLNVLRTFYSNRKQVIIYTAAEKYFPSFEEYQKLNEKGSGHVDFLPTTMAMEMDEVLILETFSGYRSKEGISCLAVFAGYDSHRSSSVIESINPSMLLVIYGKPATDELNWRLDLSKELHKRFETNRKTAIEYVSTLDINESIKVLEEYYEYLYEDYDFTISPICSKMQVISIYLFWEKYKEVQLVFPLPIGYEYERRPRGFKNTYITELEPRNSLYANLLNP